MKRGDIYLASEKSDYAGKPRPVLILQNSMTLSHRDSVTVCLLTTEDIGASMFRYLLQPAAENGLKKPSFVMVDKINSIAKSRLGQKIGAVSMDDMDALNNFLVYWLDLH